MRAMSAIAATILIALPGAAYAEKTTFNSVPANIADAPAADDFLHVERHDRNNVFRWKVRFPGGNIWIAKTHPGRYWSDGLYSSESRVLKMFEKSGFRNFRKVKSTAYAGSQWGYMAIANNKRDKTCVVGVVMDNDNHSHDGSMGGTLRGYAVDCRSGADWRYDEWRTWLRSFKGVPSSYNANLDQ